MLGIGDKQTIATETDTGSTYNDFNGVSQNDFQVHPSKMGKVNKGVLEIVLEPNTEKNIVIGENNEYDKKVELLKRNVNDAEISLIRSQTNLDSAKDAVRGFEIRLESLQKEENQYINQDKGEDIDVDKALSDVELKILNIEKEIQEKQLEIQRLRWEERIKLAEEDLESSREELKKSEKQVGAQESIYKEAKSKLDNFPQKYEREQREKEERRDNKIIEAESIVREHEETERKVKEARAILESAKTQSKINVKKALDGLV